MDLKKILSIIALVLLGIFIYNMIDPLGTNAPTYRAVSGPYKGRSVVQATGKPRFMGSYEAGFIIIVLALLCIAFGNIFDHSDNYTKPNELVILTMEKCGFCKKLKSELPKIKQMLGGNVDIKVVNDDDADFEKLSKKMKARGYPHGRINGKDIVGFRPAAQYVAEVKKAL